MRSKVVDAVLPVPVLPVLPVLPVPEPPAAVFRAADRTFARATASGFIGQKVRMILGRTIARRDLVLAERQHVATRLEIRALYVSRAGK